MLRRSNGSGYEKPQSGTPFMGFFSATFLPAANLWFTVWACQTSYTAGTLGVISSKISWEINKIIIRIERLLCYTYKITCFHNFIENNR
jgi:hypothetical protein